jgi:ATP-dependent RNA helicase DeaD
MRKWAKYLDVKIVTVFGGVGFDPQVRLIETAEIVVGTPGRTLDHLMRGTLKLEKLKCFALDEADKMVEMGFIEDIERILSATNKERQILLFGATISKEVDYLRDAYMSNVEVAEAELHVKKDLLEQYYYNVQPNQKFSLLVHLLKKKETERAIIFCSKRSTVELVHRNLRNNSVKAEMIHGKMSQNKRLNVIERFNEYKVDILVASSVAARGLDIKGITHVINYDLSQDPQDYVHRVGRTARAGESGVAITLLTPQDHGLFHAIFARYDIDANELPMEEFPRLRFEFNQQGNNNNNRFGRRQHSGYQGRGRRY